MRAFILIRGIFKKSPFASGKYCLLLAVGLFGAGSLLTVSQFSICLFIPTHFERSIAFTSMGNLNYLSTLQYVDGVVGNSSSGLAEAPTFKIGIINIGDRQKGRLKAKSIIDCEPTKESIQKSIDKLYSVNFQKMLPSVVNPYGTGNATEKIMGILKSLPISNEPKKKFYNL